MIWVWIAVIAAALFVIFLLLPAFTIFFAVFSRKKTKPFEQYNLKKYKNHYYMAYIGRIAEKRKFVKSHPVEEVFTTSYDGLRLAADYYDLGMSKTAIIFHGFNSEVYTNLSAHGAFLMKSGFNVLFVTHRSHGKSEGRWSTIGLREQNDVLSWVKWAENRGAAQILLYGVSMGGFTVAGASDRLEGTKVRSMVIDSGFYSVYEQMKRDSKKNHIPAIMLPAQALLTRLFLRVDIRRPSVLSLKNTKTPAFFLHGTDDETVEYKWAQTNYKACASEKELLIVEGAPHTLSILKDPETVEKRLTGFLDKYFSAKERNQL